MARLLGAPPTKVAGGGVFLKSPLTSIIAQSSLTPGVWDREQALLVVPGRDPSVPIKYASCLGDTFEPSVQSRVSQMSKFTGPTGKEQEYRSRIVEPRLAWSVHK